MKAAKEFPSVFQKILPILCLLLPTNLLAQGGGKAIYQFLNLPMSGRQAALGGHMSLVRDYDLSQALFNPTLLNAEHDRQLSMNYCNYVADIQYGQTGIGILDKKAGMIGVGIQYIRYGNFTSATESSEKTGTFSAGEYALSAGWCKSLDSALNLGIGSKIIYSGLYDSRSIGLAFDFGGHYQNKGYYFSSGFLVRNIGFQIKPYGSQREKLPLQVQAGISKGFAHLPLRLGVIFSNLQQPDLSFSDPFLQGSIDPITGQILTNEPGIGQKIMLHTALQAEFSVTRYFNLRFGYTHQRRQELKLDTRPGMAGLSLGASMKISKFIISYGRMYYHLSGAGNHFSVAFNLGDFNKKEQRKSN